MLDDRIKYIVSVLVGWELLPGAPIHLGNVLGSNLQILAVWLLCFQDRSCDCQCYRKKYEVFETVGFHDC